MNLEESLEVKEVQFCELLKKVTINSDYLSNLSKSLEEVQLIKEEMINQLEDDLNRIKTAHINVVKTYEAKLSEFGIPIEEMGFEPLIPVEFKGNIPITGK